MKRNQSRIKHESEIQSALMALNQTNTWILDHYATRNKRKKP